MSTFGWIKRVLFGAESLAKSGARKGKEEATELYNEGKERAEQLAELSKEKLVDLKDNVSNKAEDVKENIGEFFEDLGSTTAPLANKAAQATENAKEALSSAGEKLGNLGEKVIDATDSAWDTIADKSKDIIETTSEKVGDIKEAISEKVDDMYTKAKALEEQEAIEDAQSPTGIYEGSTHNEALEGSMLEGTDDFFSKADAYAKGEYDKVVEGKVEIQEKVEDRIEEAVEKVEDNIGVKGFEDRDGDGDEITDDAEIVEDTDRDDKE